MGQERTFDAILYAGLSDFPAWRVAAAATLAEARGWSPVAAVQLEYSLVERSAERELLPKAAGFNLGTVAWSPLGGGLLTGKYRRGETGRAQGLGVVIHGESDARKTATVDAVLAIADEVGVSPGQVAIAWVLAKGVLPIIGPRTHEQLTDNLASMDVSLRHPIPGRRRRRSFRNWPRERTHGLVQRTDLKALRTRHRLGKRSACLPAASPSQTTPDA